MIVELNRQVILFVYGLAFFVLGLALVLQSRQHSRLDLARSLPWLAAFGFTHGFHEWGDLFIPIQSAYLSQAVISFLQAIQLLLLGISFACLMEFGILLLQPTGNARILYGAPVGLLFMWMFDAISLVMPPEGDFTRTFAESNALARYAIGLPGGLLAAFGLRRQTLARIAPLNAPNIVRMLRIAGLTLAFYSLFAGLIPPPVGFFPGNFVNTLTFERAVGVPPAVFRATIGFILSFAIIRALDIFDLETERFIETMEQQQILVAERERIARELHDGVIQKVYTAGLIVESASRQFSTDHPIANRLNRALTVLNDAIGDLRRNLRELRAVPSGMSLRESLYRLADDPRFQTLVQVSVELNLPDNDSFPSLRADDVIAIVNEALSNVVRHARARHVKILAQREDSRLRVIVQDDGAGLPQPVLAGYGLRNMHDRARLLGGQVSITSPGKGTLVSLDVPWRDER